MRYIIKLFCLILKIIEEIIMKLIPQFCHEDDSNVHLPRLCEHMDRFIGADDVTIMQGTPFDPLEGVIAVDEYGRIIPFTVSPSELENPCEVGVHKFVYMTENYLDERNVTVIQAPAPTFEGLTNITVGLDESFGTLQGVTATDAHGNSVAVTCVEGSSYIATQVGQQTLHYTASDACGNVGTAERIITVEAGHFEGLTDASVNQGLGFDLRQGVTAYTYSGTQTEFSTDPDAIEACELGEQTVTYTAMGIVPTDRTITVLPIANPTISGVSEPIEVKPSEEFDPLSGVTATDGNGIDITADVTVRQLTYRTVLYRDGTFIINEKDIDQASNEALHGGTATNVYPPFDPNGATDVDKYIFAGRNRPWEGQREAVLSVEIGSPISPTSTAYWFSAFNACTSMDLTMLDTSRVTAMNEMFNQCSYITSFNISHFDTSNVTDMSYMFNNCVHLTSLDLSNFDTSKVANMNHMFSYTTELVTINLTSFDTSNVTNFESMFEENDALVTLDLSSFDTSNVINMSRMFLSATALTTIYASQAFVVQQVQNSTDMFVYDNRLVGGLGTRYSSSFTDKTRAKIDGGSSDPGYFTQKPTA